MLMVPVLVDFLDGSVDFGPKLRNELFTFLSNSFDLIFLLLVLIIITILFSGVIIKWRTTLYAIGPIGFSCRRIIIIVIMVLHRFCHHLPFHTHSIHFLRIIFLLLIVFSLNVLLIKLILMLQLLNIPF